LKSSLPDGASFSEFCSFIRQVAFISDIKFSSNIPVISITNAGKAGYNYWHRACFARVVIHRFNRIIRLGFCCRKVGLPGANGAEAGRGVQQHLSLEIAGKRCEMHGTDDVTAAPYSNANVLTGTLTIWF